MFAITRTVISMAGISAIALVLIGGGLAAYRVARDPAAITGTVLRSQARASPTPITASQPGVKLPSTDHTTPASAATTASPWAISEAHAEAVVRQHGYMPQRDAGDWCESCPLHVIIAEQRQATYALHWAFFFANGRGWLGTDTAAPTIEQPVAVAWRDATTVALTYNLYRPGDAACCASGDHATVRFRWDGARLVPLDPVPEARLPAAADPAATRAPHSSS